MTLTDAEKRERAAAWQREFRSTPAGKAHVRRMNLRARGMEPAQYDAMLARQGGVCAACRRAESGRNQFGVISLAVDHDHRCCPGVRTCDKCRRGLLCMRCNRALGMLQDSPEVIEALLAYRRSYT